MKLHQINCLFAKNVLIPNKIVYKARWECVSFLSLILLKCAHLSYFPQMSEYRAERDNGAPSSILREIPFVFFISKVKFG
jgi:hypothetical protein